MNPADSTRVANPQHPGSAADPSDTLPGSLQARGRFEDAELVRRAVCGDDGAFERLYHRYHRVVASVISAEIRRQDDVSDVVQETFALAWKRLGSLRDPGSFRAWLLQITRHAVIDHGRRMARRPALDRDDELALDLVETREAGPEEWSELADLSTHLRVALTGLSRRDATAITLAAQFGFGPIEIAEALGTTPNAAKVVLHRARARLRAAIA